MRLVWLELNRYGRFETASLNVDARVVAVLGANETGKTTILRGLAELDHGDPVDPRTLTRGFDAPVDPTCEAWFLLDEDERRRVTEAVPAAHVSRWYILQKRAAGGRTHRLEPRPQRNLARRAAVADSLGKLLSTKWAGFDEQAELRTLLAEVGPVLSSTSGTLSNEELDLLREAAELLRGEDRDAPKRRERTIGELELLIEDEALADPNDIALDIVGEWQPRILMFKGAARTLKSQYDLASEAGKPPLALANLAKISGLSLTALRDAVAAGRPEVAEDLIYKANDRLRTLFGAAWGQSDIEVRFGTDTNTLHLLVRSDSGALHRVAERSDGLKIFVALVAFVLANSANRPVLLIDEAEQHLHWDAQADLVGMLHRQDQVAQVIYTTHSPGCLPQDLGAAVRLVVHADNEPDRSRVVNSIWTEGPGFAPLLLGMGASTAAITPARRALVAEGATEFLLLATLLRQGTGKDYLDFQVVPGLAEAGDSDLFELDLAAARVAYFADGDASGTRLRTRLRAQRVPDYRVVTLPGGMVVEDLVSADALCAAITEELRRSGTIGMLPFSDTVLPHVGRAAWIDARLRAADVKPPSKAKVAARLLEIGWASKTNPGPSRSIVDRRRESVLSALLRKIHRALDLPEP